MGELLLLSCSDIIRVHSSPGNCSSVEEVSYFKPGASPVTCARFNHTAKVILCGSEDGGVSVWSVQGNLVSKFPAPLDQSGAVRCVDSSSLSRYLASGGDDGVIRIWDLKMKKLKRCFNATTSRITCLSFNTDDNGVESVMAAGSESGDMTVYCLRTNKRIALLQAPDEENTQSASRSALRALSFNRFRKDNVATCSENGSVYVWDIVTQTLTAGFPKVHTGAATDVVFSPVHKSFLISVGMDRAIVMMDPSKSKIIKKTLSKAALTRVSFTPGGDKCVVGSVGGDLLIYDLREKGSILHELDCHFPGPVHSLQFHGGYSPGSRSSVTSSMSSTSGSSRTRPSNDKPKKKKEETPAPTPPVASLFSPTQKATAQASKEKPKRRTSPRRGVSPSKTASQSTKKASPRKASPKKAETRDQGAQRKQDQLDDEKLRTAVNMIEETILGSHQPRSPPEDRIESRPKSMPIDNDIVNELQNMIASVREENRCDLNNLQLEMMRQFRLQMTDIKAVLGDFSTKMASLVEENNQLRAENERLKNMF